MPFGATMAFSRLVAIAEAFQGCWRNELFVGNESGELLLPMIIPAKVNLFAVDLFAHIGVMCAGPLGIGLGTDHISTGIVVRTVTDPRGALRRC